MDIVSGLGLISSGFGIVSGISTSKHLNKIEEKINQLIASLEAQRMSEYDIRKIVCVAKELEKSLIGIDLNTTQFLKYKEMSDLVDTIKKMKFENQHSLSFQTDLAQDSILWNESNNKFSVGRLNYNGKVELYNTFALRNLYFPTSFFWKRLPIDSYASISEIEPNPVSPGQMVSICLSLDTSYFGHGGFEGKWPSINQVSILTQKGSFPTILYSNSGSAGPDYREVTTSFVMPEVRPSDHVNISVGIEYLQSDLELLDNQTELMISDVPVTPIISDHHVIWGQHEIPIIEIYCYGLAIEHSNFLGKNILYIKQGMKTKVIADAATRKNGSEMAAIKFPVPSWMASGDYEIFVQAIVNNIPSKMSDKQRVKINLESNNITVIHNDS